MCSPGSYAPIWNRNLTQRENPWWSSNCRQDLPLRWSIYNWPLLHFLDFQLRNIHEPMVTLFVIQGTSTEPVLDLCGPSVSSQLFVTRMGFFPAREHMLVSAAIPTVFRRDRLFPCKGIHVRQVAALSVFCRDGLFPWKRHDARYTDCHPERVSSGRNFSLKEKSM